LYFTGDGHAVVLVDVRNLDDAEAALIDTTDAVIASPASGFPGESLHTAIAHLAEASDTISLHIDADILRSSVRPQSWHGRAQRARYWPGNCRYRHRDGDRQGRFSCTGLHLQPRRGRSRECKIRNWPTTRQIEGLATLRDNASPVGRRKLS